MTAAQQVEVCMTAAQQVEVCMTAVAPGRKAAVARQCCMAAWAPAKLAARAHSAARRSYRKKPRPGWPQRRTAGMSGQQYLPARPERL